MELKLSKNIRSLRQASGLTQEALAEALGVTVGAVYKWESGRSTPEVAMIAELADLFEVSVDVLLGYEVRNNDRAHIVERLHAFCHEPDSPGALAEAEKALKKYPNDFNVVYYSATLYLSKGWRTQEEKVLRRALDLLDRACLLIDQNTNPDISILAIEKEIAYIHYALDEWEQAVEKLKKNNQVNVNAPLIGLILAEHGQNKESAVYLSDGLLKLLESIGNLVTGYVNLYSAKQNWTDCHAVLNWVLTFYHNLEYPDKRCFLHKEEVVFRVIQAFVYVQEGRQEKAREVLEVALSLARWFDAAPSYDAANVRFLTFKRRVTTHDSLGETAVKAIDQHVKFQESQELTRIWEELKEEKNIL